jgi:hypothetical protein
MKFSYTTLAVSSVVLNVKTCQGLLSATGPFLSSQSSVTPSAALDPALQPGQVEANSSLHPGVSVIKPFFLIHHRSLAKISCCVCLWRGLSA